MSETYLRLEQQLDAGRLDQAESIVEHLLSHDPTDLRARVALARIDAARGELDRAALVLMDLVASHPEEPDPLAHLAVLYDQDGEHDKARRSAIRAIELGADVPAVWALLGGHMWTDGQVDHAEALFDRALEGAPQLAPAWLGKARILRHRGLLADAEEAYIRAVEFGPQRVGAWVELIELEAGAGATDAAAENLALALRSHPGHPDLLALSRQGAERAGDAVDEQLRQLRARLLQKDFAAAEQTWHALQGSARGDPRLPLADAEYCIATGRGDPVPLIHALTRMVRDQPNQWETRTLLGRLLLRTGPLLNPRLAAAHCEDAWRMSGEHPYAGLGLIEAWAAIGKRAFASALCQRLAAGEGPEAAVAQAILEGRVEG